MSIIKKICYIGTILCIYCIICHHIYIENTTIAKTLTIPNSTPTQIDKIGYIKIEKINLYQPLYKIESPHNNIEENITILKDSIMPDKDNSIIFLAAHSGSGKKAFFDNLDKLIKKDKITLEYNNEIYAYEVTDIWEEKKNGYIHVNKSKNKQLVLTTCSKNKNKQLVINSILKNTSINP